MIEVAVSPHAEADLEFRCTAMKAGFWLGWLSIAAVLAALWLDLASQHRALLLALTAAAAVAHTVAMAVPWRRWLEVGRGQALLDLWSAGLIGFVALLVLLAGADANFDLLLFLVLPFIATVQAGCRRPLWLAVTAATFGAAMAFAPDPLPLGTVALRAGLLAAAVVLTLMLARATRQEAAARAEANARAELEHALLAEAHHRVKNSLQTVADLLLLARPDGPDGRAFDDTAGRIRSIAAVHRLLTQSRGGRVSARAVLTSVAHGTDPAIRVEADDFPLVAADAQMLGIVANELVVNAAQHGRPPVTIRLDGGRVLRVIVEDRGSGCDGCTPGLGLQLVRRVVEQGLDGSFRLARRASGGTLAEVAFEPERHAHPHR